MKKYEGIKEITAAAIYDAGDKGSPCFREGFQQFLNWAHRHYVEGGEQSYFCFFIVVSLSALQKQFKDHPQWEKFLVENGFITEETEITYYRGQEFRHKDGGKFKLVQVSEPCFSLIDLGNGNAWIYTPTVVENKPEITAKEFGIMTDHRSEEFTLIGKGEVI